MNFSPSTQPFDNSQGTVIPLSPDQVNLLIQEDQSGSMPGTANYGFSVRINQTFTRWQLQHALDSLTEYQPALRLVFPKELRPFMARCLPDHAHWVDVHDYSANTRGWEKAIQTRINQVVNDAFDLAKSPPLQLMAFHLPGERMQISLVMHHLICDVRSFMVFFNSYFQLLAGEAADTDSEINFYRLVDKFAVKPDVADYGFWGDHLANKPVAELPAMNDDSPRHFAPAHTICENLNADVYLNLKDRISALDAGFSAVSLSAFELAMAKITRQTEFVIGMPMDLSGPLGMNTLFFAADIRPIDCDLVPHDGLVSLCRANEGLLEEARQHYLIDLQTLANKLPDGESLIEPPVIFSFVRVHEPDAMMALEAEVMPVSKPIMHKDRQLHFTLIWNTSKQSLSVQILTHDDADHVSLGYAVLSEFMGNLQQLAE